MSTTKLSLGVLQRISEFLADLPEDQITDLAEGRARLAYVPVGGTGPVVPVKKAAPRASRKTAYEPSEATKALLQRLGTLHSREDATLHLATLPKTQLKDAARALTVPGYTRLGEPELRHEIVEATVGRRVDSIATRGFDGPRP
jgi:hypothetical protein